MTPTQADLEEGESIADMLMEHGCNLNAEDAYNIGCRLWRHRLAAEAAAFEKAAGVFSECVVEQSWRVGVSPASNQSPGEWRDAVRQAAIRKLAGEKHD